MHDQSLRLLHELEVHQIELEMQNAELLRLKEQAEVEAGKYLELYDFSPSGYFTISEEGTILELNLAGANMLGNYRSNLQNRKFDVFLSNDTRLIFHLFVTRLFKSRVKEYCEVTLSTKAELSINVRLNGIVKEGGENCFVTAVDISEHTRASQLSVANEELLFQNDEKAKRAAELIIANKELLFQNDEKAKRTAELIIANKELLYQNDEKANRATELIISNEVIAFQRDRLQKIASLVPGVVYQYRLRPDGSSCFPYASDAIQSVYRVTPEEVREDASKAFANIHPDDLDAVVASNQQSAKDLSTWQHDYRVKFDDGTISYLNGNAVPQLEADGSVLWHGFITDITDRKQMEEALKQSDARYSSMISNITDVIAIMDANGFKKYESPNLKKIFGWLPEETADKSAFSFIHPDDMEYALNVFNSVLGEDRSVKMLEFRYECKDGTYKPIELTISNLLNDPLINGLMVSFRDISDRKLAEELLLKSEAKYISMITNISDVIGIMGADGLMTYKSANIEKYFGWLPEERIGTSGFATIHPDDIPRVQSIFNGMLEKENSVKTVEFRYECKDGSYKPIELTAANLLNDPVINGVLLNYRDISERKEKEQKIILQNEELQKLNTEKDKFFSIIAHDLRGPMGGFMQLTELMTDEQAGLTENEIKEMTVGLSHSARNTFNLLENLLEWSQGSRGNSDFNPEKIDLKKVIDQSVNILAIQANGKGIEIVDEISSELGVIADKNMLQTVVRNLLSNAIKFTPKGGRVTISATLSKNKLTLVSVKDSGIGMSEELKNKLFRIDTSTKRSGTQGEPSTGLGLLLCKEFVERLGGTIVVESELKIGSVFSFTIPSADVLPKQNEGITIVQDETKRSSPKNLNILIAEDDDISAILLTIMLKGFLNQSFRARTGAEAVEIFRNNPGIDLVMMDIKMPGMDGYEAARQIRLINLDVIILAQTTFAIPGDRKMAIEAGCNDYLTKPIHSDELLEMMTKYFILI